MSILILPLAPLAIPRDINIRNATSQLARMGIAEAVLSVSPVRAPASPVKAPASPTKAWTYPIKAPASPTKPPAKRIYTHHRNLKGIIKSFETPTTVSGSEDDLPSFEGLGVMADQYLQAHGYVASAVLHIVAARNIANCGNDFTEYLCTKGMPTTEAEFLWNLIMLNEHAK
jgi:hypothetical protein